MTKKATKKTAKKAPKRNGVDDGRWEPPKSWSKIELATALRDLTAMMASPDTKAFLRTPGNEWRAQQLDERAEALRAAIRHVDRPRANPPTPRNPKIVVSGDVVRLASGEEGTVESVIRGQVYVRTRGGQLRACQFDDVTLIRRAPVTANPMMARPEHVDPITEARVRPSVAGGVSTGSKVIAIKQAEGAPVVVFAKSDDLDPSLDRYGIDPRAADHYRSEAAHEAEQAKAARSAKPLARDADPDLLRLGLKTTFKSAAAALKEFEDLNSEYFYSIENTADDLDVPDMTIDFMDRLEVGQGRIFDKAGKFRDRRKHVALSKTARGKEILRLHGTKQIKAMLKYLFGTSKKRQWRRVPWYLIDDYLTQIGEAIGNEAKLKGYAAGVTEAKNYPLASGMIEPQEFMHRVARELGPAQAQKIANIQNSQHLWNLSDRLAAVLKPPAGASKEAKAAAKCVPKAARAMLNHRVRVLRDWAQWPSLVPEAVCVVKQGGDVSICTYPLLAQDVSRVETACMEPYDVEWAAQERRYAGDGAEDLYLPWEVAAANPKGPKAKTKARLMR